ncbi:hypothetical protein F4820DRAFT_359720 [Hypoxylon rubiginosum]|uniref:Uncharacterized protein n=1 Tax=Hypoxylon rubiginosum TaxID=110542 RepID=A0ACB9YWR1_9PEZI|nr:hypothetical protein F4820DRAFT_359720 [Hypoxylon rubiginosum]
MTMGRSTGPRRGEEYPLTVWWHITNALTSVQDVLRFSQVSKGMSELLAYRRAVMEAEHYMASIGSICQWDDTPHPIRSCVENAIRRDRPVKVIESMVRGCFSISGFYLNGTEPITRNIPAIFVAAELNRVDVVKLLLEQGSHQDLRYPARQGCIEIGHYDCCGPEKTCRNALCVAREHKSRDVEDFLLREGAEDRCGAQCSRWHY